MLLTTRKLAFLSLLLAVDVILIVLSGILELNTIFLLAAASFCVGIALRESGKQYGFGFYLASILLGVILAPNKFYVITYAAFGLYLVIVEYSYDKLLHVKNHRVRSFWIVKYITFNMMYLPMLIFLPKLLFAGELNTGMILVLAFVGQLAILVFDRAYEYFQRAVWGKVRNRLKL